MESKQIGTRHLLRIDRGEPLVETLTQYMKDSDIRAGSIMGIGAATNVHIGFYSLKDQTYHSKEFAEEVEIVSLQGNVSVKDGEIWPHIHIVIAGKDYEAYGGHLEEATVSVTCELIIDALEGDIKRTHDRKTGLKIWNLA